MRNDVWRIAIAAILTLGVIVLAVTVGPAPAAAHSWYSRACCDSVDCRPVPNGTVRGGPNGWVVQFPGVPPQVVPYSSTKVKPIPPEAPVEDRGVFHVCTHGGKPTGTVLCIYVPDGGA